MSKIPPTEYDRAVAIQRTSEILRRWFPPAPAARIADLVDVLEMVLKNLLPGYHVRISIEPINSGLRSTSAPLAPLRETLPSRNPDSPAEAQRRREDGGQG